MLKLSLTKLTTMSTVFIRLQADLGYKPKPQTPYAKNQLD